MDPKIKERWVKALRSGKYKQGKSLLKRRGEENPGEVTYCCLGVLCDLYCKSNKKAFTQDNVGWALPGKEVLAWAGLPKEFRKVGRVDLPDVNDTVGREHKTFEQIADLIEKSNI